MTSLSMAGPAADQLVDAVRVESLSAGLQKVLDQYLPATGQSFTKHPVAQFMRGNLKELVVKCLGKRGSGLLVKGSCGQGQWANGPWIGVFDPLITVSAQSQYYICFLFREDMAGVYLTLVQAMTEAKATYRSDARTALRARGANFRALLGKTGRTFHLDTIDLAPAKQTNDTTFYEAGTICATYFASGSIPSDELLADSLDELVTMYADLIVLESSLPPLGEIDSVAHSALHFEDTSKRRLHERIERNKSLIAAVKRVKGTTCEACGTSFEEVYGSLGDGYIEAHHLTPISSLESARRQMDPMMDFAVLCSNCHRMIHRSEHVSDIEKFRRTHLRQP